MRRHGVAFVSDSEAGAGLDDLITGILICSQTVEDFEAWSASTRFAADVRRWSRRILPCPWIGLLPVVGRWWRKRFAFDLVEKIQLFSRYIADHSAAPDHATQSAGDEPSGAHWSHALEVGLRSELGWTNSEINTEPMSKAIADYFALAERRGVLRILRPEDMAMGEENAKTAKVELSPGFASVQWIALNDSRVYATLTESGFDGTLPNGPHKVRSIRLSGEVTEVVCGA
jgi:hypothetical protein